ncbi:MAG: hypothetical protein AAF561_13295, partial [Planctomycetota bacterium]
LEGGFQVNINFQPAGHEGVDFARADFGRPFATRGNGLRYGWNRDLEAAGDVVDRNSARDVFQLTASDSPSAVDGRDERYDTIALPQNGDEWRIEVPNGTYAVGIVVGDPDVTDPEPLSPRHRISVNGEPTVFAIPLASEPFGEGVGFTRVTDGLIRVQVGNTSIDPALLYLRIAEVEPRPIPTAGESIAWTGTSYAISEGRVESGTFRVGDMQYVVGGFAGGFDVVTRDVFAFDVNTGDVVDMADLPETAGETHAAMAFDEARGHYYWIGGQIGTSEFGQSFVLSDEVFRYDVATDTWETLPIDVPALRFAPGGVVHGDTLHFVGGTNETRVASQDDHFTLDLAALEEALATNTTPPEWQAAASLPREKNHLGIVEFNDELWTVGGEHNHTIGQVPHSDVWIYSPATDTWREGPELPQQLSHNESVTFVREGRIFVLGGQIEARRGSTGVFSVGAGDSVWARHTDLPISVRGGIAFFDDEGNIHYAFGEAGGAFPVAGFEGVVG